MNEYYIIFILDHGCDAYDYIDDWLFTINKTVELSGGSAEMEQEGCLEATGAFEKFSYVPVRSEIPGWHSFASWRTGFTILCVRLRMTDSLLPAWRFYLFVLLRTTTLLV